VSKEGKLLSWRHC